MQNIQTNENKNYRFPGTVGSEISIQESACTINALRRILTVRGIGMLSCVATVKENDKKYLFFNIQNT